MSGCCFCCPQAISALFCLYVQSGCNQGVVAGALTFFPPEPALYTFQRRDQRGNVLNDDCDNDQAQEHDEEETENDGSPAEDQQVPEESKMTKRMKKKKNSDNSDIQIRETREETNKRMKSPMEQLMHQVQERHKRSKQRNLQDAMDAELGVQYSLLLDPRLQVPPHDADCIRAIKIPTLKNVHIAAVAYVVPAERKVDQTLIISHGNATDIGAMFPIQVVLAHALDVNVVVYDYSGYGESGGIPNEASTYSDLESVIDYCVDAYASGNPKNIILYGQSVGSGPCCNSATKEAYGGMILHSPFTSGMRVLTSSRALACLDIYPNIDRIPKVKCPVMILHGCLDQEVDISHGQELQRLVPARFKRDPWWVPDRGHNDITDGPGRLAEYIRRLRTFLEHLELSS